jgi:hypothetical protein
MSKSKNPYLENLGQYIPQGGNKFDGGNPLGTAVNIAQQSFKNNSETRNKHDDDADFYGSIAKDFNAHRSDAGALLGGFSEGLQHGAKRKSTAKKQESLDKYNRVMEYLQNTVTEATKRNEWYQKREFAKQKYLPQMLTYAQSVNTLDPQSRKMMLDDIMNGYNESIGEDNKVVSIDGSNPFLVTVKNGAGKLTVMDTRNLFDGDPAAQAVLSPLYPQYLEKQQEARKQREFENERKADEFELQKFEKGAPSKYSQQSQEDGPQKFDYNGHEYDVVPLKGLQKGEITDYGKMVNKAVSQISTNEKAIKAIHDMRVIFERNPNIGESWVNMLSSGDDEDSWTRWISKKVASRQERADMEILKKLSSDLNLSTVLSVPGKSATDILKRAIQASSPTGTLTKQAFDKVSNDWEERAIDNIDTAKAQAHARTKGQMIISKSSSGVGTQQSISRGTQQAQPTSGSRVAIFDPKTKQQLGTIGAEEVDQAIAEGFLTEELLKVG